MTAEPPLDIALAEQARRIAEDGYTLIEDFLAPDDLAEVRRVLALYLGTHAGQEAPAPAVRGRQHPRKAACFMPYLGVPAYVQKCEKIVERGYEGFALGA